MDLFGSFFSFQCPFTALLHSPTATFRRIHQVGFIDVSAANPFPDSVNGILTEEEIKYLEETSKEIVGYF
jgi:hypothetical protein